MNRRYCLKQIAALGISFVLPVRAHSKDNRDPQKSESQPKISYIRVGQYPPGKAYMQGVWLHESELRAPDTEHNYLAEAIEYAGKYYYRAKNTIVEISEYEYRMVIINPNMYYFSSALKLHIRIQQAQKANSSVVLPFNRLLT